jgi:hypothetical protein
VVPLFESYPFCPMGCPMIHLCPGNTHALSPPPFSNNRGSSWAAQMHPALLPSRTGASQMRRLQPACLVDARLITFPCPYALTW